MANAMTDHPTDTPAERLRGLEARLRRLSPSWQRPERFFETRSAIAHELHLIARDWRGERRARR
jgi:hypothetical protein